MPDLKYVLECSTFTIYEVFMFRKRHGLGMCKQTSMKPDIARGTSHARRHTRSAKLTCNFYDTATYTNLYTKIFYDEITINKEL